MFDRLATRIRRLTGRVLPGDPLLRSFAGGATWSLLGSGAARGLTLIASIIIARGLGKEAFGGWALILTTVGTFSLVATMGLGVSLTKHVAESYRTSPERAGAVLSLVISVASITVGLASIVCWYSSSWLANVFFATPLLEQPLRWTALLIFFAVFSQLMQAALLGFSAFRAIAIVQFVHSICVVLLAYPLTKAFGLTGGVIAATTGAFAGVIVATTATVILGRRHGLRVNFRDTLEARSILHRFALPAFLADAISVGALTTSQALVARIPGGLSGLGSYQAAVNLRDVVLFVPGAIRSRPCASATPDATSAISAAGIRPRKLPSLLGATALPHRLALATGSAGIRAGGRSPTWRWCSRYGTSTAWSATTRIEPMAKST